MVMASTLSGTLFFSQPPLLSSSRFPTSKNSPILSPSSNKPFCSSSPKSLLSLLRKWSKLTALSAAAKAEVEVEVEEDPRCLANNGERKSLKSVTRDFHLIGEAPESSSSLNGNYTSVCLKIKGVPLSYIYNGIKMTLLVGLLAFQGSQQAIADTEFAGRMHSLAYFGDLGDINTVAEPKARGTCHPAPPEKPFRSLICAPRPAAWVGFSRARSHGDDLSL